jgi:hypothetical protein
MTKKLQCAVFILCALTLIGCPEHVALKKEQRASIRSVSINANVPIQFFSVVPDPANPSLRICILSGGQYNQRINDVQIWHYWKPERPPLGCQPINEFMIEKHNIVIYNNVGQILREKLIDELQNSNLFNISKSEKADAEFHLKIRAFELASAVKDSYQPILMVDGSLVKHESEILWKKYAYVTLFNTKLPAHRIVEYINSPELIRDAAAVASKIIAEDLVNDLKR